MELFGEYCDVDAVAGREIVLAGIKLLRQLNASYLWPQECEYELLTFLASHPDKVFSRVDLMEQVWNYGYVGDDVRTVDVTVRRLREKIEDDPASPRYILTRRGVGYYYSTL